METEQAVRTRVHISGFPWDDEDWRFLAMRLSGDTITAFAYASTADEALSELATVA